MCPVEVIGATHQKLLSCFREGKLKTANMGGRRISPTRGDDFAASEEVHALNTMGMGVAEE